MITWLARATRSTPRVLDTKGKERETRTLHSITFSWSSWGRGDSVRLIWGTGFPPTSTVLARRGPLGWVPWQ